jgi:hypothetical protein
MKLGDQDKIDIFHLEVISEIFGFQIGDCLWVLVYGLWKHFI